MPDRSAADEIRAAGAVVWRDGPDGPQIALVHRPKYDDWTIPKGKCEPGEHMLLTAVREVAEETGQRVRLGRRLSPSFYELDGRPKRVDYWVARSLDPAAVFVPGREVDDLAWLPLGEAAKRLTYERDMLILEEFAAGPAVTAPLILLRHAPAGRRSAWRGADLARPLDARGAADADKLAWLLRCFGSDRVITSLLTRATISSTTVPSVGDTAAAAGAGFFAGTAFFAGAVSGVSAGASSGFSRVGLGGGFCAGAGGVGGVGCCAASGRAINSAPMTARFRM